MKTSTAISGLFAGEVAQLGDSGRRSAIVKTAISGRCSISPAGLAGDYQADHQVHGGPGKALLHYPAEHYTQLAAAFPAAMNLQPGSLGENISTRGLVEAEVCIGDIFRLGNAEIQLSQPRTPCWKIDHRCSSEGMARYIAEQGLSGWYYRVLSAGEIGISDTLELIERPTDAVSIAEFWSVTGMQRPSPAALERIAAATGLEPTWVIKLEQRATWLKRNPLA